MKNVEFGGGNPELSGVGKNLETTIGKLPEDVLLGVKNVFISIRDLVTERV